MDRTARSEETSLYRFPCGDWEWKQVGESLRKRMNGLGMHRFHKKALEIRAAIEWLDPIMERYCGETCPSCQDPCCNGRNVFYNRTDLITLLACGEPLPPGQTRKTADEACRYLRSSGCSLSRTRRPYVCVWFLCEPQMVLFQGESARLQRQIVRVLGKIRENRLLLESLLDG